MYDTAYVMRRNLDLTPIDTQMRSKNIGDINPFHTDLVGSPDGWLLAYRNAGVGAVRVGSAGTFTDATPLQIESSGNDPKPDAAFDGNQYVIAYADYTAINGTFEDTVSARRLGATGAPAALAGDANRDRWVNDPDLAIMKANYGKSPRVFTEGDFNYDGIVNTADWAILPANYGTYLPPHDSGAAATPAGGTGGTDATAGGTDADTGTDAVGSDTTTDGSTDLVQNPTVTDGTSSDGTTSSKDKSGAKRDPSGGRTTSRTSSFRSSGGVMDLVTEDEETVLA